MKTVFITGASGYVGSHIADALLDAGYTVVGLARNESEMTLSRPSIRWIYSNLSEFASFECEIKQCDVIVHCAMNYDEFGVENESLDRQFSNFANSLGKHFIYTGNLYGDKDHSKITINEDVYNASTYWRFEQETALLNSKHCISVIRLGFVYGGVGGFLFELMSSDQCRAYRKNLLDEAIWPMIHVKDLAMLYLQVIKSEVAGVYHGVENHHHSNHSCFDVMRAWYRHTDICHVEQTAPLMTSSKHIEELSKRSIQATNENALSIGWQPKRHFSIKQLHEEYATL